jgi:HSP20 family molecular chaperone IbpA
VSDLRTFGRRAVGAVLERVGRGMSRVQERSPLPHDVLESDDAYLVVFDAPGATRSDVQVRFLDGEVQVRIDRFRTFHEGYEMRFPGRGLALDGDVRLPDDAAVEADEATATLRDDGTLAVHIPKNGTGTVEIADESDAESESDRGVSVRDGDDATDGPESDRGG